MAELTLAEALAVTVHQVHVMVFRRPVDASEPLFFCHSFVHSQSPISLRATRDVDQSLYWRSKAQSSHWASKSRPPAGALVPPGAHRTRRGAGGIRSLPARWLGSRTLSDLRPERSTLRFATLHSARSARQHPQTVGRMVQGAESGNSLPICWRL